MSVNPSQLSNLKDLLDREHSWPSSYTFKFIVKRTELELTQRLFELETISLRDSASGKYVSITFSKVVQSSDEVIRVYKMASTIPGLMAL